jgi:DNA (cytosine-5)-methyltransferase 1
MKKDDSKKLKVVELFAGVGGFRVGLEGHKGVKRAHHKYFDTIWFNQWEPSTVRQHAHETYVKNFGDVDEYTNVDVAKVTDKVPDHDLLVGGFPCQDYSVARNLSSSAGLEGKKGVLWWSIYNILQNKGKKSPNYLMLENVDRLLASPAKRRGRDFAIILSSLNQLGYVVEWRIVNAAEYGFPQRRKRIFILGFKKGSPIEKKFRKVKNPENWITKEGLTQNAFPAKVVENFNYFEIDSDPVVVSNDFNKDKPKQSPFSNSGVMFDGKVCTVKVNQNYEGIFVTLGDILIPEKDVPNEYHIKKEDVERWKYLKGAKSEPRKTASGFEFLYKEGSMAFPDSLSKASRTIITGEGGASPSRFKHIIKTPKGYRRLTPLELERLCMFPDNHTEGHPDIRRAFFMGNALVVGVIDKLGESLIKLHRS